jgi:FkbM family methyltransferase
MVKWVITCMNIRREFENIKYIYRQVLTDRKIYQSYSGIVIHAYDTLGARHPGAHLPFRGRLCHVKLKCSPRPFAARIHTTDLFTLDEIFTCGEYAPAQSLVKSSAKVIVDLGANVGYSLRWWLDHFPDCRVWSAEPDPGNVEMCRLNMKLGGITQHVKLLEACVRSSSGPVYLRQNCSKNSFTVGSHEPGALRVIGVTVDELLADCRPRIIDILKCDIEGSEADLFGNPGCWLQKVGLLIIETHPPYTTEKLLTDLAAAGTPFELVHRVDKPQHAISLLFLKNKDIPAAS